MSLIKIRLEFSDGHLFKYLYLQTNLMPEWFINLLTNGKEKYWYQVMEDDGRLEVSSKILECAIVTIPDKSLSIIMEKTYIMH